MENGITEFISFGASMAFPFKVKTNVTIISEAKGKEDKFADYDLMLIRHDLPEIFTGLLFEQ